MKRTFVLLCFAIILSSCSKDENIQPDPYKPTPDIPEKTDSALTFEEYYNKYCFGFKVKDTSNLKVMGKSYLITNEDTTYLIGTKDNKLWISRFNTSTKECFDEFICKDEFNLKKDIHLGYGEYKNIEIKIITVKDFYVTNNGFASRLELNQEIKDYIISNDGYIKEYLLLDRFTDDESLFKWYNNSFICRIDAYANPINADAYTCFDDKGNILFVQKSNLYIEKNISYPLNYKVFANFYQMYNWDEENPRPCISVCKYELKEDNNYKKFDLHILSSEKDVFTVCFHGIKNNSFDFSINIIEYSGNKYTKRFILDINTWKAIEK